MGPGEPLDVGHFGLAGIVEYVRLGADGVQFQQGAFGKAGEGVLPEVEFQHAGEVLPGDQVRGDVGFGPRWKGDEKDLVTVALNFGPTTV